MTRNTYAFFFVISSTILARTSISIKPTTSNIVLHSFNWHTEFSALITPEIKLLINYITKYNDNWLLFDASKWV